jgi:hypothetical protein
MAKKTVKKVVKKTVKKKAVPKTASTKPAPAKKGAPVKKKVVKVKKKVAAAGTIKAGGIKKKVKKKVAVEGKKVAVPVKKKVAKPRRAAKQIRLKAFWGVFNQSLRRVALFEFNERKKADDKAVELSNNAKGTPHFVMPVKEQIEE